MSQLAPCGECGRHVRVEDPTCPFCGAAASASAPRRPSAPRFSRTRAAVFYLGATLASGCDGMAPAYGGPPPQETIAQPYGAPPEPPPERPPGTPPEAPPSNEPSGPSVPE
jgi:hypothetical protein